MFILTRRDLSQKVNVNSEKTVGNDLHSKTASGEMPRTECRSIHDLTKAFDTVSRDGLWKIMAKFGCPPRFIAMVRQFHDGMQARV